MKIVVVSALVALGLWSTACTVHEETVRERPPSRCAGGEWVERHRGPHGRWHDGYWRCPGEQVVVDVD